jgi:hypothetical protein
MIEHDENLTESSTVENEVNEQQEELFEAEEGQEEQAETEENDDQAGDNDAFIPDDQLSESVKQRVGKLTWQKHDLSRKNKAYEQQIAELQAQVNDLQTKVVREPRLEDFDYDQEKYNEAVIDHKVNQKLKASGYQQPAQAQPLQPQYSEAQQLFLAETEKYAKQDPSFNERMSMVSGYKFSEGMENFLVGQGADGVRLYDELLKNPDELIRIEALDDISKGAALSGLMTKIKKPRTKLKSNASKPANPISRQTVGRTKNNSGLGNVDPIFR